LGAPALTHISTITWFMKTATWPSSSHYQSEVP